MNYSSYARGAAIWIAPGTPFKMKYMEGDVEGRYVVVRGELEGLDIILVNSYGPNVDDVQFYSKIQEHLSEDAGLSLIWAGDYNCVLDGVIDRTPPKLGTKPKMSTSLRQIVYNLNLTDIWRSQHPDRQEYTCHSGTHNTYSRLDRMYTSWDVSQLVLDTKILEIGRASW